MSIRIRIEAADDGLDSVSVRLWRQWRRLASLCLVALVAAGHTQSPDASPNLADARQTDEFLGELERAIRGDDRKTIASMVHYPITITMDGFRLPFPDPASLLERYETIFTLALEEALRTAVVLGYVGGRLGITAIVVPRGTPEAASKAAPTRAGPVPPRRISIVIGPRPTRVSGALPGSAPDAYLVSVPKGKLLEVRLERVQEGAAVIHVRHDRTRVPLDPKATDGARFVRGRATESADYRIDVERAESADSAPLPYVLSLTLR
jgi:hypothetical protein